MCYLLLCSFPGGWGAWFASFIISWSFFSSGMAMAWTSSAFLKIRNGEVEGLSLSPAEMSLVAALPFVGRFFSPIPNGYIMDCVGRHGCLIFGRFLQVVHWFMLYFSHDKYVIYGARILNGWFSGMALFVIPIYVGETTKAKLRGRTSAFLNLQFILGTVFESAVGAWVSYDVLILISVIIEIVLFLLLFFVPETPYFYIKRQKVAKAEKSLKWLRGEDDVSTELSRIQKYTERQMQHKRGYLHIFKRRSTRKGFVTMQMLMLIQRCSGMTALIPYGSFVMPDTWWLPNDKGPILLNATYFFMCAFSGYFVDSWGRKKFLVLSSGGSMVFMFAVATWYYMYNRPDEYEIQDTKEIGITLILLQASFYSLGLFYIPTLIMGELFPMNIKAKANALGAMTAVAISAVVVGVFLPITDSVGMEVNFLIYALAGFIGLIYCSTVIETRGKTLEAIQSILEGRGSSMSMSFSETSRG